MKRGWKITVASFFALIIAALAALVLFMLWVVQPVHAGETAVEIVDFDGATATVLMREPGVRSAVGPIPRVVVYIDSRVFIPIFANGME